MRWRKSFSTNCHRNDRYWAQLTEILRSTFQFSVFLLLFVDGSKREWWSAAKRDSATRCRPDQVHQIRAPADDGFSKKISGVQSSSRLYFAAIFLPFSSFFFRQRTAILFLLLVAKNPNRMTPPVTFHSFSFVSFHFSLNQNLQRAPIDILDLLSAHIWDHQICCEWSLKPVADPSHGGSSDGVEIGKIQRKKNENFLSWGTPWIHHCLKSYSRSGTDNTGYSGAILRPCVHDPGSHFSVVLPRTEQGNIVTDQCERIRVY